MSRQPTFRKLYTGNKEIDRLQDHLREMLNPVLANPLIGASDFRFQEVAGTGGAAPTFALQYRTPGTQSWVSVGSFTSAGVYSPDVDPSSTAGGWVTALDLDFTAQASQTLSTDGNYTIGGLTFKKENSANDATAMALTNGTGLVIKPVSAPDYNAGTRTCPLLWLQLSQLTIPKFSWTTGFRIWAYISAENNAANFDNALLAVDGDNMTWSYAALRGHSGGGGGPGFTTKKTISSTTVQTAFLTALNNSTSNVLVMSFPQLVGNSNNSLFFGTYSSGWPAENALAAGASIEDGSGGSTAFTGAVGGNAPTNYGIVLGALRAGSATSLSVTFARLRVDYRL